MFQYLLWYCAVGVVCLSLYQVTSLNSAEFKKQYWEDAGKKSLQDALNLKPNNNVAKNIILFIGDGMGVSTITSANIYKGQKDNMTGEEQKLIFQKFPHVALIKTYSVDKQVPDSAATATAILTGVKTRSELIGLTADANVNDCNSAAGNEVYSIMKWAQDEGKDTGFVTTTRVTHATPAAMYAHTPQRDWESDKQVPTNATMCKDIARQLIEDTPGKESKVIFGGGRKYFMTQNMLDVETNQNGSRGDGRDLIEMWRMNKNNSKYVTHLDEFNLLDPNEVEFALGLFEYNHMQYEADRNKSAEPSITQMTEKAIQILNKNEKGYFLLVEGGRIDHAHHDTVASKALEDTVAMAEAVERALEITNPEDTLIIVTADHSHVMTINGYPDRGNPILGVAGTSSIDKKAYTTLLYTNGPGQKSSNVSRADPTFQNTKSFIYTQQTAVPLPDETHGGEEVALFATGPMAHLFHGVKEQSYIAYAMGYASCVGPNKKHCDSSASTGSAFSVRLIFLSAFTIIFLSS